MEDKSDIGAEMPTGGKTIKFHESRRTFFWVVPSRTVYTADDNIISRDCYNLAQAREAVHEFLNRR
jgi:hypothetical protein